MELTGQPVLFRDGTFKNKNILKLGVVTTPLLPTLGRLGKEHCEFMASLGYIVRPDH